MMLEEFHISSLIVRTLPENIDSVSSQVSGLDEADVYAINPEGKLVVVIETGGHHFITKVIEKINGFSGVLGTSLIFHQIDYAHKHQAPLIRE